MSDKDSKKKLKKDLKKAFKIHKKHIVKFDHKGWAVAVFLVATVVTFLIQGTLETTLNPDIAKASVKISNAEAKEALKINEDYRIFTNEGSSKGHYLKPGDTDIDVYSFGIQASNNALALKEVKINIDRATEEQYLLEARLYENDEVISEADLKDGTYSFNQFISVIQPGESKEYFVKLDVSQEAKPGNRFKFTILGPYDLLLIQGEEPVYSLDNYPLDGAYTSIVGNRSYRK